MSCESIVYVWGGIQLVNVADNEGQLGLGKNRGQSQYYVSPKICHYKVLFTQVSCGKDHTALVTQNGHIYTMGSNEYNKLGHSNRQPIYAPQRIESLNKVIQVSCGYTHTACITMDGHLYTWGDNEHGQLGVKESNNQINRVTRLANCKQISCGNQHTLLITTDNDCFGFGLNENAQLAQPRLKQTSDAVRIKSSIKQCVAGNLFSIFLTLEGVVYICGEGFGNLQKLNYKAQFTKIDGKSTPAGLTTNNELIFFELDESLSNIKDFSMGDLVGLCQGDKLYQWQYDPDQKRITQLKCVDSLSGRTLLDFSTGNGHIICLEQKSSSFIESVSSSTTTLRGKHEERSKSNYIDKQDHTNYSQRIQQLEKQLEEKDKLIAQMKNDFAVKYQAIQQKCKDMENLIQAKDKELSNLKIEIEQLTEDAQRKCQDSKILQCQVQDETFEEQEILDIQKPIQNQIYHHSSHSQLSNLTGHQKSVRSPIKTMKSEHQFEDSLQKKKQCKTDNDQDQKYQSFEKLKKKENCNERQQSLKRDKLDDKSEKSNLSTIKSRLTDLQKNKEQLEQRMRQFEDRLKENKLYTK